MIGVRVFWALIAGFLVGVGARSVFALNEWFALFLIFLAIIVLIVGRKTTTIVVACFAIAVGLGIARMQSGILQGDPVLNASIGKTITIAGVVVAEPDDRDNATLLTIHVTSIATSTRDVGVFVLAQAPARTQVSYGEHVRVTGQVQLPAAFDTALGRQFNYPGYLAAQGIGYQLAFAKMKPEGGFSGNIFVAWAIRVKQLFIAGIDRALSEPEAGLGAGITAGDKRGLGPDLTNDFRAVSLVHIIVLSGYNITVVIAAMYWVCKRLRAPRIVRFGAGIFIALFFALMTGFAAASLRASLMALIAITGEWSGRVYRADRALGLVAALMIFLNPYSLMFDPGFQLSFLATVGLMAFSPSAAELVRRARLPEFLREIGASTVSAQIAVLPLLLYQGGQLSLVALPANLLVLFLMPQAMLATLFAALAGLLTPFIAPIIGLPAYLMLAYIILVAHVLAHVPFATVAIPAFGPWLLVVIYSILFGGVFLLQKQKAPLAGPFVEAAD